MEIINDVTAEPEGEAVKQRSTSTRSRILYLQIAAFILEIFQPLVVQFLVVSHVSNFGDLQNIILK